MVVAHAQQHAAGVGADRLAHPGHRVGQAELGGQKGVGGVRDGLGGAGVGDDQGNAGGRESRAHPGLHLGVVGADHDPVGVQGVVEGGALAQEFGVRHHGHVGALQQARHRGGRPDGAVDLSTTTARRRRWGPISAATASKAVTSAEPSSC